MVQFVILALALLVAGSALTTAGLIIPAALLFPLPVGLHWARGQFRRALALMAVAAVAAYVPTASLAAAAVFVIVADLGMFLGAAAHRRWSFGWCVAVLTAVWFALGAGNVLLHWDTAVDTARIFMNARVADLEEAARAQSAAGREVSENHNQVIEAMLWMREHLQALFLGAFFGMALFTATAMTWVYQQALAREGGYRIPGSFSRMRPPEWLVWVAIALAGMWFIDYRWPNELLRNVTWNAAVGLSFVYWLNGLGIMTTFMLALQWHPLLIALCIGMVMAAQLGTVLGGVGLFDTWYGFRERIAKFIAERQQRDDAPLT